MEGKFTCHKYNGSSVNDIAATSYDLYPKIKYLRILDPVWFSDHCPLICAIDVRLYRNEYDEETELASLNHLPNKYKWDEEGANAFKQEVAGNLLRNVEDISYTSPDKVADQYEQIITSFARKSLKVCKNSTITRERNQWMNQECFQEKRNLKVTQKAFVSAPDNLDSRQRYLYQKYYYVYISQD